MPSQYCDTTMKGFVAEDDNERIADLTVDSVVDRLLR